MQVYLDIVILRGTNYRYNVLHSRNWSAAFLIGSLKLLCILLLDNMYPTNCATKQYVDRGECLPPKFGNDLGDRLVVSALPDFFEWQSLFGLLVLLLLLLVVKGFYQLRFARRLEGRKFDVDQVLANPNSSAMAVSFAGYCFGQGLVLVGVTTCADNDVGRHIGNLFGWTAIGCILMFLSQFVNDKLIIRRMDNTEEILKDNLAVGIMEAGLYIATGLVVRATVTGAGYSFAESLAITFTFWALSQVQSLSTRHSQASQTYPHQAGAYHTLLLGVPINHRVQQLGTHQVRQPCSGPRRCDDSSIPLAWDGLSHRTVRLNCHFCPGGYLSLAHLASSCFHQP